MTILDEHRDEILRRVRQLEIGQEFSLRTLFGGREEFERFIPRSGLRKSLGRLFRKAVVAGEFDAIAYAYHNDSPSEHWYSRQR